MNCRCVGDIKWSVNGCHLIAVSVGTLSAAWNMTTKVNRITASDMKPTSNRRKLNANIKLETTSLEVAPTTRTQHLLSVTFLNITHDLGLRTWPKNHDNEYLDHWSISSKVVEQTNKHTDRQTRRPDHTIRTTKVVGNYRNPISRLPTLSLSLRWFPAASHHIIQHSPHNVTQPIKPGVVIVSDWHEYIWITINTHWALYPTSGCWGGVSVWIQRCSHAEIITLMSTIKIYWRDLKWQQ